MSNGIGYYLSRFAIYFFLTLFALIMLFPFLYMISTSLKTSDDVFNVPPRLLPYSPVQRDLNGEMVDVFIFNLDGTNWEMYNSGERLPFGFFALPENLNADNPRESRVETQVPIDEATETDQTVTAKKADGTDETFPIWTVTVNGQTVDLALAYRSTLNQFVAFDDPSIIMYGSERTAEALEEVDPQFSNYNEVFALDLDRALINTTVVTVLVVIGQLITSIFGGYAFSRVEFRGRDTLFLVYLGSIMIPFVVLIIPMYRLMVLLNWQNTLVSLIVPWIFTAYGTFLMRQFFVSIPKEIEEAALMDGCSRLRILWGIFVPLSMPSIATLGIFSFLYAWNSFLWPLLIIGEGNTSNHVLTLALIRLSNAYGDQPNIVLTGAAIAILPPVIVFIFAQRYFIESVASSGVKG
jgi:ABC-type glycerol-3-phosphate transport system permease component